MTALRLLRILAWLLLIALAIVTIGPIGMRPVTMMTPPVERALALVVVGLFFGLAYPHRILMIGCVVVSAVILFELLQLLEPFRHGRFGDAIVKIAGAVTGLTCGRLLARRIPGIH